jgi:hypothetical protein
LQAAKMVALAHVGCEDKTVRGNTATHRLPAHIALGPLGAQEPEHATRRRFKKPAPEIEDRQRTWRETVMSAVHRFFRTWMKSRLNGDVVVGLKMIHRRHLRPAG